MAAERAAAASRAAGPTVRVNGGPTPVMAPPSEPPADDWTAAVAGGRLPSTRKPSSTSDGTSLSADRVDVRGGAVGRVEPAR